MLCAASQDLKALLCWIQLRYRAVIICWGQEMVLPSVLEVVGVAPNGATPMSWTQYLGHRCIYRAQTPSQHQYRRRSLLSDTIHPPSPCLQYASAAESVTGADQYPPGLPPSTQPAAACSSGRTQLQSPLSLKPRSEAEGTKTKLGSVSLWTFCSALMVVESMPSSV